MKTALKCLECGKHLTEGVEQFSLDIYGYPLCLRHQADIAESGASPQAIDLYFALKFNKIPVILEYWDGHKHVDIALPGKLYIEVNGAHHYESIQALIDLRRTVYALKENISTIFVPNYLLSHPAMFRQTVEELTKACKSLINPIPFSNLALSVN
jgi:hypothetical protein